MLPAVLPAVLPAATEPDEVSRYPNTTPRCVRSMLRNAQQTSTGNGNTDCGITCLSIVCLSWYLYRWLCNFKLRRERTVRYRSCSARAQNRNITCPSSPHTAPAALRSAPASKSGVEAAFPHRVTSTEPGQEALEPKTITSVRGRPIPKSIYQHGRLRPRK